MAGSDCLLQAALRYADLGYRVFPCAPGSKVPLTEHGFYDATTDAEQIEQWWAQHLGANIGLPTEGLVVIDIDGAGNPWLSDQPERMLELAKAPMSLTPRGGSHRLFRQPASKAWRCTEGRLAPKVDTRTSGGYILVPPSMVDGTAYRWAPGLELDGPLAALPEPPSWLAQELDRLANGTPTLATNGAGLAEANAIPEGQRNATLAKLAGSMRRVGMSQAEITAALLRANADRCMPPLAGREVERIATSIARYEPDQVSVALVENHWDQMWSDESASAGPSDPGPFPLRLLAVPGFISQVMQYNLATAVRPQPVLALAAAICLQAVLAARKVRDERGNRTNLYVVGIGESGQGKDHGRKVNRLILFHAGVDYLEGNEDIASDAGLITAVELQPAVLFQMDEFGRFLRTIGDPKKAPHLFNVVGTLMKLYSSADTVFRSKAYADSKRNKVIDQPCVSLYGTTVPEHFFESLTADGLADGFVARLLPFEANANPPRQRTPVCPPPSEVIEGARFWGEFRPGGNLREEHPVPVVVHATADAQHVFDDFTLLVDHECTMQTYAGRSLWTRAEEKACRLALVYACSAKCKEPVIDGAAAQWACDLSAYLTRRMLFLASQWVSEGLFDAKQKKVIRLIRAAGGEMSRNELCRKTQSLTVRERADVLENLKATGQITERVDTPKVGRPKVIYALR